MVDVAVEKPTTARQGGGGTAEKPDRATTTQRRSRGKVSTDHPERVMKMRSITTTELAALSFLNPVSVAFLGWGLNVWLTWKGMPKDADGRDALFLAWSGALLCGAIAAVGSIGFMTYLIFCGHKRSKRK